MKSLCKVRKLLDHLYFELMLNLEQQGEITYYYKLFLHVLYEVESSIYYLRDVFHKERERISDLLKREGNRENRRFWQVYL